MATKSYSNLNLFIRSLCFSVASLTLIVCYSVVCMLMVIFPLRYRHAVIRSFTRRYLHLLKVLCHIDYRVTGLENLPPNQVGVVLSKHQSTWETFFLPLIFHNPAVIAKRELLWIPFFGWGLATAAPITINRNNKTSAMQQVITKGKLCLEAGRWIIVFPEGTRVPPFQPGHYKLGGARLAVATGYPVIPVAHNAGHCWPRRRFIKQPGTIDVVIGPCISVENKTPEVVLAEAKDWIEKTMHTIEHRVTSQVDEAAR